MWCSSSNCSSVGPFHVVTSSASKPAQAQAPLFIGPQVLLEAFSCVDLPQNHSLLQTSPCSSMGFSTGCKGYSLPHHRLLQGLQGNLCSGAWSTTSSSTGLGACGVVSLTFLLLSPPAAVQFFPVFLKYVLPEVLALPLRSWPAVGPSWSELYLT